MQGRRNKYLPGDLVSLVSNDKNYVGFVQSYKIENLAQLQTILNKPGTIASVSNKNLISNDIPALHASFKLLNEGGMAIFLGYVNIEDYGHLCTYNAILFDKFVYLINNLGLKLEVAIRKTFIVAE